MFTKLEEWGWGKGLLNHVYPLLSGGVTSSVGRSKQETERLMEYARVSQLVSVAEEAHRVLPHGFTPFSTGTADGRGAVAMLLAGAHAGVDFGAVQSTLSSLMDNLSTLRARKDELHAQVMKDCGHCIREGETLEQLTFREAAEVKVLELQALLEVKFKLRWDRLKAILKGGALLCSVPWPCPCVGAVQP